MPNSHQRRQNEPHGKQPTGRRPSLEKHTKCNHFTGPIRQKHLTIDFLKLGDPDRQPPLRDPIIDG